MKVLHIDVSPRGADSTSRKLSQAVVDRLTTTNDNVTVVTRDLVTTELPFVSAEMLGAFYTAPDALTDQQKAVLTISNTLTQELLDADTIVVGVPMWNFGVPASLKAWFDLVARVGVTFRYTPEGPVGLAVGKKVIFTISTGGVPLGSDWDFTAGHLKTFFGFLGITEQEVIAAEGMNSAKAEESLAKALEQAQGLVSA